jgi:energy-coupling factor transport system ATP-binding protein
MTSANAITVSDLAFRYLSARNWAIDGLSLEVAERELLGISGPSGAGTSTLCLSLSGLIPNVVEGTMRGTVNVAGIDTRERDVADITSIVGVVFQDPRSQLTGSAMTVEEEVAFGLQNMGVPRSLMRERIAEALGLVGLSGFEMRIPFELSGGEQQRLSLATVIAMRPDRITRSRGCGFCDARNSFRSREIPNDNGPSLESAGNTGSTCGTDCCPRRRQGGLHWYPTGIPDEGQVS